MNKIAYFVSEPDNGIYDAMNKGINAATGDVLCFLNADDMLYHSSIITNVVKNFADDSDFLYGDTLMLDRDSGKCHIKKHNKVNKAFLYANAIPQQAIFYRKKAFKKCGYFNTEFKIAGDREWLLRAFLEKKLKSQYLEIPVALFVQGGVSNSEKHEKLHAQERKKAKNMYFNNFGVSFTALIPKPFKIFLMKAFGL